MNTSKKVYNLYDYLSVLLLLVGMYTTARTAINLFVMKQYPSSGVLPVNLFSVAPNYYAPARLANDCFYPQTYYGDAGSLRSPNEMERNQEKKQQEHCVNGLNEERENVKMNDMAVSAFFLTLGAGTVLAKKYFL